MDINVSTDSRQSSWWGDVALYSATSLLFIAAFCWGLLFLKSYWHEQEVSGIDAKISGYGTQEQKLQEQKVLSYKKKIEDFSTILAKRNISSRVFAFIEENTLPDVWFSNFSMSRATSEIRLSGEAKNMEVLSRQFNQFEQNTEYVKTISLFNSQIGPAGAIRFVLNVTLDPKIFEYVPPAPEAQLLPGEPAGPAPEPSGEAENTI